jgi:hypothetical protein
MEVENRPLRITTLSLSEVNTLMDFIEIMNGSDYLEVELPTGVFEISIALKSEEI